MNGVVSHHAKLSGVAGVAGVAGVVAAVVVESVFIVVVAVAVVVVGVGVGAVTFAGSVDNFSFFGSGWSGFLSTRSIVI
jgi:hypothetical protein